MTKIHRQGLTSLLTFASFTLAAVSGVVAVFRPEGRVAYWVDWHFWGLSKTEWDHLHLASSVLLVVAAGVHIYFNWRVFFGYFYNKARQAWNLRREMTVTALLGLFVAIGAIREWPPFNLVFLVSDSLRSGWVISPEYEPPFGHAEQLSLKVFCKKMQIDLDAAVMALAKQGIKVGDVMTPLEVLAKQNGLSAMLIYQMIKPLEQSETKVSQLWIAESIEETFAGTGVGHQTLEQFCAEQGLELAVARSRLTGAGLPMEPSETFKQAASRHGRHALDILKTVLIEKQQ